MPVQLTEKKDEYDIRAEIKKKKKEDLDIDLNDNYLTIRAKKEFEKEEKEKSYHRSEFKYGEFMRSIYIPQEVDIEKIDAELEHGVLKIRIPKLEKTKDTVKKIVVK